MTPFRFLGRVARFKKDAEDDPRHGVSTSTMKPLLILAAMALVTPALADPCKAVPDHGPAPRELLQRPFSGRVSYVGDGDSLCVALGPSHQDWVEVRLEDFYAPELHEAGGAQAKANLSRLVMDRTLACDPRKQSYDRIVATCRLNGRSVGDLLRSTGEVEGGRGYAWSRRR